MKNSDYYLVHANIAVAREALDHPVMAGFMDMAEEIDALAASSPGFVTQPSPSDIGSIYQGNTLLNVSIWETVEDLKAFTFSNQHEFALTKREDWFVQGERYNFVLYWESRDYLPTEQEVTRRIEHLRAHGPTAFAFTFDQSFSVDDAKQAGFLD